MPTGSQISSRSTSRPTSASKSGGANALRYGANSIGGAINFVPRTDYSALDAANAHARRRFDGERAGVERQSPAAVPGGQHERHDGLLHQRIRNRQDGFQDNSQQARERINANIGLQPATIRRSAPTLQANVAERISGSPTNEQMFFNRQQTGVELPAGAPPFFACVSSNQARNWGRYYTLQDRHRVPQRVCAESVFEIIPYSTWWGISHKRNGMEWNGMEWNKHLKNYTGEDHVFRRLCGSDASMPRRDFYRS